jgi:hypothetical protein
MRRFFAASVFALVLAAAPAALASDVLPGPQTETDGYTRYELLAPGSGKFHILYEVTATSPGAKVFFNPIRRGSVSTDEHVYDRATGQPLPFSVVDDKAARAEGLTDAEAGTDYIRVALARPVPADGGQGRILIDKTYQDENSYFVDGDTIGFDRPLGIKRNTVVLPKGYELVSCNYPSQVIQQPDGRIAISFLNGTPAEAPLKLRARRISLSGPVVITGGGRALDERAHQNRDIVYFLQPPETHKFALYHDFTETRAGEDKYVNVVRDGSHVEAPSARNLDTGEVLSFKILKGDEIAAQNFPPYDRPEKITPQSEVVGFSFPPVPQGGSTRLRMSETYTDPESYKLIGPSLYFHRSFGRALDAVVLPKGWRLTNSSIPGVISETASGQTRIDFTNPRNDEIDVLITAERR